MRSEVAVVELRGIEQPAVYLPERSRRRAVRVDRRAMPLNRSIESHGSVFHAFEVVRLGDRLLEPAERPASHRPTGKDTTLAPIEA